MGTLLNVQVHALLDIIIAQIFVSYATHHADNVYFQAQLLFVLNVFQVLTWVLVWEHVWVAILIARNALELEIMTVSIVQRVITYIQLLVTLNALRAFSSQRVINYVMLKALRLFTPFIWTNLLDNFNQMLNVIILVLTLMSIGN